MTKILVTLRNKDVSKKTAKRRRRGNTRGVRQVRLLAQRLEKLVSRTSFLTKAHHILNERNMSDNMDARKKESSIDDERRPRT